MPEQTVQVMRVSVRLGELHRVQERDPAVRDGQEPFDPPLVYLLLLVNGERGHGSQGR